MRYTYLQATFWAVLYLVLALSPLALMLVGPWPSGRGFWMDFGVALGFIGLAVLSLQFVITGRYRNFAMGFGSDNLLQFHLATGIVAMGFVLLHPLIIIVNDTQFLVYFDPTVNFMRAFALVGAALGAIIIVVTSLWRQKFKLIYEWWRLSHGVLAFLVLLAGLTHTLQVGHFTDNWWSRGVVIAFAGAGLALLLHTRLVKPYIISKTPYKVTDVVSERADGTTLVIEADGHEGMHFEAGQFAWITLGDTPFSLQQHPFSFSSSADDPTRLKFTSKPLGDWTKTWPDVDVGTTAFLEGPYGAFTLDWDSDDGAVFVGGGIGITPIISILRTMSDRNDQRPCLLFYANSSWEEVIFRDEIDELEEKLNLKVVHVLEEPPEDWEGEEGFVDAEVLDHHLREPYDDYRYYICGPEPMMNMVESELVDRDITLRKIMSERFEIV